MSREKEFPWGSRMQSRYNIREAILTNDGVRDKRVSLNVPAKAKEDGGQEVLDLGISRGPRDALDEEGLQERVGARDCEPLWPEPRLEDRHRRGLVRIQKRGLDLAPMALQEVQQSNKNNEFPHGHLTTLKCPPHSVRSGEDNFQKES